MTAETPTEHHYSHRTGWLRAAVLGANDGIVSTSSLVVGIAAANMGRTELLVTAVAGLVAGAMSMAAGEYVSVSSQSDTEKADLEREQYALTHFSAEEHDELAQIYVQRGLDEQLAAEVAEKLMAHDALETHAREELGLSEMQRARPLQAALASALAFTLGALLPVFLAAFAPMGQMSAAVSLSSLIFLAMMGSIAAKAGGAPMLKGATRVTLWGALAMAATAAVGKLFGVVA